MNLARLIALAVAVALGAALWRSARTPEPGRATTDGHRRPVAERGAVEPMAPLATKDPTWPFPAPTYLPLAQPPYHGLAVQVHSIRDAVPRCQRMIHEIAALGANTVMFSLDGYQTHVESTDIRTDPAKTLADRQWLDLFDFAHRQGLRVVLMPKILLSDPRGNNWRGKIQPPSWDEWFRQYKAFVVQYARLAEQGHVAVFIVGSELVSTEKLTDHWRDVIAAVRQEYGGLLSYSANWDHYRGIRFWDDLDLIGMTSYHRLSDEPGPSLQTLQSSWDEIKRGILEWQRDIGKPILFTEAGWCSQEGCSVEAWNYFRQEEATPAGLQEQQDCYQAFVDTWADEPAVGGIIWWEWSAGAAGPADFGYTPKGKPAERVLHDFLQRVKARRQTDGRASAN